MLQRVQSIFLMIASGSLFSLLANPMELVAAQGLSSEAGSVLADGSFHLIEDKALLAIGLLSAALFLVSIFLFKNRNLQIKSVLASCILVCIMIGLAAYDVWSNIANSGGSVSILPTFGSFMPLIAFILGVVAVRFIKKDEKLVRSMDRLR
jgi:hypothetical protein